MRKLKVMTIVGTRPEIIRLSRLIPKLDQHCDHVLVHTGQNYDYELNEVFFSELGIRKPDTFLECAGTTAAETIGQVIISADRAMDQYQPEA
jgi:UDP-N-acetylglucosamine 2-epimerase